MDFLSRSGLEAHEGVGAQMEQKTIETYIEIIKVVWGNL